jgi:hypothetical protein
MRRGALIGALLLIGVGVVPIFTCRSYTGSRI